ncbi:S-layer family protein [Ruminiclostridium sufflavum DSM 19573]|uniref:S-layer family protein n=1 Tax=Ruminiclostridium sufflavum DSM 19573 TaxID=1121337 RepID=A0A318XRS6_9FIRM|nr:S-layer homology domain-containing protein [Ruminiclostridium sufflavum]PYG88836.1 S-layer family protein [Ruminiclostridium sufflavum DSM 19573]
MKKIISMLLAVVMTVTFMVPVMASEQISADNALANAIKVVKEKIEIPKECNKFNYDINSYGDVTSWNLEWSSDSEGKAINVTIDENNLIKRYYSYDRSSSYDKKIPKYSKEQGREIAEKFINVLDEKLIKQFELIDKEGTYSDDSDYSFNYVRVANGIAGYFNNISVSVNKYTGAVSNYSCSYAHNVTFEDASKLISKEQAEKAFIDKLGLKLVYKIKTEDNKPVSYLTYIPKYTNKYIDALTGEVEKVSEYYSYDQSTSEMAMGKAAMDSGANIVLTPEELDAVKGMSDVMSKESVDKKARGISLLGIDDSFKLSTSYLNKDWRDNETFIWYLSYTKELSKDKVQYREVQIDAKSGEILGFDINDPEEGAKAGKTKEEAKAASMKVLKELMASKYDKLKYDESYTEAVSEKEPDYFVFRFNRIENGIECSNNYVSITYDNKSGKVTSASSNWVRNVSFEAPEDIISADKAYDILFDKIGYEPKYIKEDTDNSNDKIWREDTDKFNAVLGYFINTGKPAVISAATGDILDDSGEVYKENTVVDYTDISGLKAENQIRILTEMSIRYNEDQLKPNENLLQKDYFVLLSKLNGRYYFGAAMDDKTIDEMYKSLIFSGIITKEEKAPMSAITREQAAKYFVRFLGYKDVAEIKGIYKSSFKDAGKIDSDLLGYVCIASGMKAMNGSNGLFNPKSNMTRLEGLLSIYSYLSNK